MASIVQKMTDHGIAVVGHVGLTPQSHVALGGYGTQAKSCAAAMALLEDAKALQDAGACCVVLEMVPSDLATIVTNSLNIPTIGIGAGNGTSGQVLVSDDMLGLSAKVDPKPLSFVKQYVDLSGPIRQAFQQYVKEVRSREFPAVQHSSKMPAKAMAEFKEACPSYKTFSAVEIPISSQKSSACKGPSKETSSEGGSGGHSSKVYLGMMSGVTAAAGAKMALKCEQQDPQVIHTVAEFREWRRHKGRVGFVPTMGSLHAGHLSLVDQALDECEDVVVSIFVNPSQFAAHEDLDRYPRNLQDDLEKLRGKVSVVFVPSAKEMYPDNPRALELSTTVDPLAIKGLSEDSARPHFFRGVATVCTMLFNIVQPTHAYFGQKDAMQCVVIENMVRDLHMPINVRIVPTGREEDGLAMSSRNKYLTPKLRSLAPIIYETLTSAQGMLPDQAKQHINRCLKEFEIDYVSVADPRTMKETSTLPAVASVAVRMEDGDTTVRLLDNIHLLLE